MTRVLPTYPQIPDQAKLVVWCATMEAAVLLDRDRSRVDRGDEHMA